MDIEVLSVEITRNCNLRCAHCLRGEERNEYMSSQTIYNVFKDIKGIDQLLLTGGEPFLALHQMKEIVNVIKKNNIKVKEIWIATNGTVLSKDIVEVLNEMSNISSLKIVISKDIFHDKELERLGLYERRMINTKILKEMFNAEDQGEYDIPEEVSMNYNNVNYKKIVATGRAKNISEEKLDEINSELNNFELLPVDLRCISFVFPGINKKNNRINGNICVDVHGNVTGADFSFDEEDDDIRKYKSDLNILSILKAVINFKRYYLRLFKSLDPDTPNLILEEVFRRIDERQRRKHQK